MATEIKSTQTGNFNLTFVDRPEVQEVFGDRIRSVAVVEGVMHVEICSTRMIPSDTNQQPTVAAYTTGRWALPLGTAISLRDMLVQHLAELERQGQKVMPTAAPPTPATPRH